MKNKRTISSFLNKSGNSHLDNNIVNAYKSFDGARDGQYVYIEKWPANEIKEARYEYEEYSSEYKGPLGQRLKDNQGWEEVFHESDLNYTKSRLDTTKDGTRIFVSKISKSDFMGESFMSKALIDEQESMDSTDEIRKSMASQLSKNHKRSNAKKSQDCCWIF